MSVDGEYYYVHNPGYKLFDSFTKGSTYLTKSNINAPCWTNVVRLLQHL